MGYVLKSGKRPDILVTELGRAPVVIETKFAPDTTLGKDALARLGAVTRDGREVAAVVAVMLSDRFKEFDGGNLRKELHEARDLKYAVYQPYRFPERGYVDGGIMDIAQIVSAVSLPAHAVSRYVDEMSGAIGRIAELLDGSGIGTKERMARLLWQKENEQTWNVAALILSNAFVFHSHMAGERGIRTLYDLIVLDTIPTTELVVEWSRIRGCKCSLYAK